MPDSIKKSSSNSMSLDKIYLYVESLRNIYEYDLDHVIRLKFRIL